MSAIANDLARIKPREGAENDSSDALKEWQMQLLPFMKMFIMVTAAASLLYSVYYMHGIFAFVNDEHDDDRMNQEWPQLVQDTQGKMFILEMEVLDRSYHHRSSLLMARIGTIQLAFVAGMVLAFMGTMLILGKMSESASKVTGGSSQWHVGITSASPGIILSFFGVVLIVTSLVNTGKITPHPDTSVYFPAFRGESEPPRTNPAASEQPEEESAPGFTGQIRGLR